MIGFLVFILLMVVMFKLAPFIFRIALKLLVVVGLLIIAWVISAVIGVAVYIIFTLVMVGIAMLVETVSSK